MVTVILCIISHAFYYLTCFSVGQIAHMTNRKQCTAHGLHCEVAPPNILLWCFETTYITNHVT